MDNDINTNMVIIALHDTLQFFIQFFYVNMNNIIDISNQDYICICIYICEHCSVTKVFWIS